MKTTEKQENRNFLVLNASVVIMLILMACSTVIFAQPSGGGKQGPPKLPNSKQIKKMVAEMAEELSLDEKQESKVLELYESHFKEVEEATSNGRPDRSTMEALKSDLETDVKAVLNADQQEEYTAYLKKNSSQQRGGQGQPR